MHPTDRPPLRHQLIALLIACFPAFIFVPATRAAEPAAECRLEMEKIAEGFRATLDRNGCMMLPAPVFFLDGVFSGKWDSLLPAATDPWGNPYQIAPDCATLVSGGPDGRIRWRVAPRRDGATGRSAPGFLMDPGHPWNRDNIAVRLAHAGVYEGAKRAWAWESLERFHAAALAFRKETGRLPASPGELALRHFATPAETMERFRHAIRPIDPWGSEYRFDPDGSARSLGADRKTGGRSALDDLVFPVPAGEAWKRR